MNKKQVLWHIEALEEYSEWQNEDEVENDILVIISCKGHYEE